ncbi:Transcription factor himD [Paramyrothecium foliicola]|nr:Transcription factor himD [Paramyrothecium foliicola]
MSPAVLELASGDSARRDSFVSHLRSATLGAAGRTTQIEERLNGLVELLKTSGDISSLTGVSVVDRRAAPYGVPSTACTSSPNAQSLLSTSPDTPLSTLNVDSIWIPDAYNRHGPRGCICRPASGLVPGAIDSDENLLQIYREKLAGAYPFVVFPKETTPKDLQATRPFLLSCIRMVASFRSMRSMQGQMYRLIAHISECMLLRSERSLDLLSGIGVILGWHHYHCFVHAQMHNLTSLAATLVAELGLKRRPSWQERTKLMVVNLGEIGERTNEEKRLLLAVWYLSSWCVLSALLTYGANHNASVSMGFQQLDPMIFSPYMKRCLQELETAGEFDSDAYLVQLIRLQEFSQRIADLKSLDEVEEGPETVAKAPLSGYITAFRNEFETIRASMPQSLRSNQIIRTRLNTTYLRLHEPPRLNAALLKSISESLTTSFIPRKHSPLDDFYLSNAALRAWFDDWLSFPASSYYLLPLPISLDIIYAITILGRWAKLAAPSAVPPTTSALPVDPSGSYNNKVSETAGTGGDTQHRPPSSMHDCNLARTVMALKAQLSVQPGLSLDVTGLLGKLGDKFEQASAALAAQGEDSQAWGYNIWAQSATKLKIVQLKVEQWAEMVAEQVEDSETDEDEAEDNIERIFDIPGENEIGIPMPQVNMPDANMWSSNFPTSSVTLTGEVYDDFSRFLSEHGDQDWGLAMMGHPSSIL